MAKINVGGSMPDFTFSTPFRANVPFSKVVTESNRTALVFLRYYGCPLCQYDIAQYAAGFKKIKAVGGNLLVVLQSDPDLLKQELSGENPFPFEIVCDPQVELYKSFEILPAASQEEMGGPNTMLKVAKVQQAGYEHGRSEGEELQLPAAFIVNPDLTVTYARYGKTVDDVPEVDELAGLLK